MLEWTRNDLDYAARRDHLLGTTSGGLNGATRLNPTKVFDDGARDTITGGTQDRDWFFAKSGSGGDQVKDKKSDETVTAI
jgi:hypothetical protein